MFVATFNGTCAKVYINVTKIAQDCEAKVFTSKNINRTSNYIAMGEIKNAPNSHFYPLMDDLRFYNVCLSRTQIVDLMEATHFACNQTWNYSQSSQDSPPTTSYATNRRNTTLDAFMVPSIKDSAEINTAKSDNTVFQTDIQTDIQTTLGETAIKDVFHTWHQFSTEHTELASEATTISDCECRVYSSNV